MFDKIMEFLHGHTLEMILGVLFALSEALGSIDYFKSSTVFGAIKNGIKWLKDKLFPPKA